MPDNEDKNLMFGGFLVAHGGLFGSKKKKLIFERNGIKIGGYRIWNDTGKEFISMRPISLHKWQILNCGADNKRPAIEEVYEFEIKNNSKKYDHYSQCVIE